MARELKPIDITNVPELLRIVEEVQQTNQPRILKRDSEELAILSPVTRRKRSPSKAQPVTHDDSLFRLIGIGKSGIPGGVSGKKHEYLARAYRHH